MKTQLNGWRRIGLLLVMIWVVSHVVWAVAHYFISIRGMEVDMTPVMFEGIGSAYTIAQESFLRAKKAYVELWAWRWQIALIVPISSWLIIEFLVVSVRWVLRGFSQQKIVDEKEKNS